MYSDILTSLLPIKATIHEASIQILYCWKMKSSAKHFSWGNEFREEEICINKRSQASRVSATTEQADRKNWSSQF